MLDRQVQIVGLSVDSTNNGFLSDLNQISFSEDLSTVFYKSRKSVQGKGKNETVFSKYKDFVTELNYTIIIKMNSP